MSLSVKECHCCVCGKPATILQEGRPHCPAHEIKFSRKEELPMERKVSTLQRGIRKKSQRCNVPNCEGHASWRCDVSGFRYCDAHKAPHGTSEQKLTYSNLRVHYA
ncbi:MAG: hypothetical protein UY48_C0049G0002 [Candidatus Gottesmanbacteria bacterium GW2011_GWB1_49_7]|uniref:Uncharacterized protein n=1 Tax=Candidatus Gottesmanbacteria bacterium GW2011_GWB1_49_7 TaxID=1618448 RepID=A0A0G1YUF5_9BACT|nr:MAG: hypothetical protein UY48_C0049G0002 [Candidatus Gottesmanbacteria bacterium GW2011_GWB1_49_7]